MSNGVGVTWVCSQCSATAGSADRPQFCTRCLSVGTFVAPVYQPGVVPGLDRDRPRRVGDLGAGILAKSLGDWDAVLGRVGRPYRLVIAGPAGSGKTTGALKLAGAIAGAWGAVLYAAVDEGAESVSFKDKIARLELQHSSNLWVYSGSWPQISRELVRGSWAAAVLDSGNNLGLVPAELNQYADKLGTSWIVTLEVNKDGQHRGDAAWPHWADAVLWADHGRLKSTKNRYAPSGLCLQVYGEVEHV